VSPFVRRLVIRGDLNAAGLVMVLGAPLAVLGALSSGLVALHGVAFVLAVAGLGAIRWSRTAYRGLLAEVAARHAGRDPGSSPVPWVSDALWRAKNRFDPAVDAANELLAEVDSLVSGFGGGETAVVKPQLRPLQQEERALVGEETPDVDEGPEGTAEALVALLEGTPGRFLALAPRWPVCCGRLCSMTGIRGEPGAPDGSWLPSGGAEADWGDNPETGFHRYQCGTCGRRYSTDPAW
jgi:hypothetical protein